MDDSDVKVKDGKMGVQIFFLPYFTVLPNGQYRNLCMVEYRKMHFH
jgi:hypothetical protein